jgi:hypothetical protein
MSYTKKLNQLLQKHKITPKKRVVFLLGAGAARIWAEAPSSNDLMNKLLNDTYYRDTIQGLSIPQYIKNILDSKFSYGVNFETIIAFLEEVLNYSISELNQPSDPAIDSILPFIFQFNEVINDLNDYRLIGNNSDNQNGEELNYYFSPRSTENLISASERNIKQICFRNMLVRYLGLISSSISHYDSYYPQEEEINQQLGSFIQFLHSKNNITRFYTTNYDRKLPNLFKDLKIFDGFNDYYSAGYERNWHPADLKRITEDRNCITYYNLHGCINWHERLSSSSLFSEYFCNPHQCDNYQIYSSQNQTNPGQKLFASNIITGYNKSQRITISPFNHLFNSFYTDLAHADTVIIIGYSLNDPHLNGILKNNITCGNPKVIYIDMFEGDSIPDKLDKCLFGRNNYKLDNPIKEGGWFLSQDKSQCVFQEGFAEFLNDKSNWHFI